MKKIGLLVLLLMSSTVFAETLSPNILPAGKSIFGKVLDSSNVDVTTQYSLSYAGTELKIILFNGKPVLVGSIVGNYNVKATKNSDLSVISLPVSVTSGTANSITIFSGSSQSGLAGTSGLPIKVKVLDGYKNPVPNTSVSFSVSSGSATIGSTSATTDASGIAQTSLIFGATTGQTSIKASIIVSGLTKFILFTETTTAPVSLISRLAIGTQPTKSTLGTMLSPININAVSSANSATSYAGVISVAAYKNNACSVPSTQPILGTLSVTASAGSASFSDLQPQAAEPLFLKFSSGTLSPVCSQLISLSPPASGVSTLRITQLPTLITTNKTFFPSVKVAEFDSNNQVVVNSVDQVQITAFDDATCSQASASQLTNSQAFLSSGYATFSSLKITEAKIIYIKASVGTVSSACSPPLFINGTTTSCPVGYQIVSNSCVYFSSLMMTPDATTVTSGATIQMSAMGGSGQYTYGASGGTINSTGIFSETGSLNGVRAFNTSSALPNGKVLIVGGNNGTYLSSAEIYDPATGSFSPTGSLTNVRSYHTASVLTNGKVLIVGGLQNDAGNASLSSAEIYDPATGSFYPTGSLATPRYFHTASVLANGKVLIVGGQSGVGSSLSSAEIYDPATESFSPTGSLTTSRYLPTATVLYNGKVLIAGGQGNTILSSAEIYNPVTGSFYPTGSMTTGRYGHAAVAISKGRVLITGGIGVGASAEVYNPATGSFTLTGSLATSRYFHTASMLANGKALIVGGGSSITSSAEVYDPDTGSFMSTGSLANGRYFHTASVLTNGKILVSGGQVFGGLTASAEIYDQAGLFTTGSTAGPATVTVSDSFGTTAVSNFTIIAK